MTEVCLTISKDSAIEIKSEIDSEFAVKESYIVSARSDPLSLNDYSTLVELIIALKGPLAMIAPILLFWIGKGKVIKIRKGNKSYKLKGYSAHDAKILIEALEGEDE